jgi:lactate permease
MARPARRQPKGKPVSLTEFTLNLLTTPGTQMLIAGC